LICTVDKGNASRLWQEILKIARFSSRGKGIRNNTAPGGTTWDTPWNGVCGYAEKRRVNLGVQSTASCRKDHITLRHTRGGNGELQSISIQSIA